MAEPRGALWEREAWVSSHQLHIVCCCRTYNGALAHTIHQIIWLYCVSQNAGQNRVNRVVVNTFTFAGRVKRKNYRHITMGMGALYTRRGVRKRAAWEQDKSIRFHPQNSRNSIITSFPMRICVRVLCFEFSWKPHNIYICDREHLYVVPEHKTAKKTFLALFINFVYLACPWRRAIFISEKHNCYIKIYSILLYITLALSPTIERGWKENYVLHKIQTLQVCQYYLKPYNYTLRKLQCHLPISQQCVMRIQPRKYKYERS